MRVEVHACYYHTMRRNAVSRRGSARFVLPGAVGAILFVWAVTGVDAQASGYARVTFINHGTLYSIVTGQGRLVDPQIFMKSENAKAGVGLQNIPHAAGVVPLQLDSRQNLLLYNAEGNPLNLTLGKWIGATGTMTVTRNGAGSRVVTEFSGLIPGGSYSLFVITFNPAGDAYAPADGTGLDNSFTSDPDGTGAVTVESPVLLTDKNAVVLVYHSDGNPHGADRGVPGITAHDQLAARLPF